MTTGRINQVTTNVARQTFKEDLSNCTHVLAESKTHFPRVCVHYKEVLTEVP